MSLLPASNGKESGLKGFFASKKTHLSKLLALVWFAFLAFSLCQSAYANPILTNIAAGVATVQQTQNTTTIQQTSGQAILNWQSFNIQPGEITRFVQPLGGITLNRVDPNQGISQIFGQLTSTGQIVLINPAGVYFGPNSYVNVGGIMVSTANMSDRDFLNGNFNFAQVSPYAGSIVNDGTIQAKDYGYIALMAPGSGQ